MMQHLITILFFFWMVSSSSCHILRPKAGIFNVLNYGAVGDGKTDASKAFLKAWGDFCQATTGMPVFLVPGGKTFLVNPIMFEGPCKSNRLNVKIDGSIVAPNNVGAWGNDKEEWIQFSDINNLIVNGKGRINGQGQTWWKACQGNERTCARPTALNFHKCDGLSLSGLTHINSARNHISINQCTGVDVSNLKIIAPDDSPNTDGIDISRSTHMNIRNSLIGTGDDCIAINGFSSYINISGLTCGPGHGISIGSLGKNGAHETVEEVHVSNCKIMKTTNGLRIKTWKEGSGFVRKISYEHIKLQDVENPIIIDQNYNTLASGDKSGLSISDITYRDVKGSCADDKAITLNCLNSMGCTNIVMDNVKITSPGKKAVATCVNGHGTSSTVSPVVPCLSS